MGISVNSPVSRSKPIRYSRMKPTGKSSAPSSGRPVRVATVTAKAAPRVRIAPAMNARSTVMPAEQVTFEAPTAVSRSTRAVGWT